MTSESSLGMSVGSSSGFGSSSPSQQRKIEQIVLETLFRLVETVLVNRLRGEELAWLEPSPQEVDSSKYAKLQLRLKSLTGLRKAMKDWKDDIYKPLQLEIWGINTNAESGLTEQSSEPMEGQAQLLELYYIHYRPYDPDEASELQTPESTEKVIKHMRTLYTRLSVLIRSLYSCVAALPCQRYRKDDEEEMSSQEENQTDERITYVLKVPRAGPPDRESVFGYDQHVSVVPLPSTYTEYGVLDCYFMYHMQPGAQLARSTTQYHVPESHSQRGLLDTGIISDYATLGDKSDINHSQSASKEEQYSPSDIHTLPANFMDFDLVPLHSNDILGGFQTEPLFHITNFSGSNKETKIHFRRITSTEGANPAGTGWKHDMPELPVIEDKQGTEALRKLIDQQTSQRSTHRSGRTNAHAKGAELIAMAGASNESQKERIGISASSENTCDYAYQRAQLDKVFSSLGAEEEDDLEKMLESTLQFASSIFHRLHERDDEASSSTNSSEAKVVSAADTTTGTCTTTTTTTTSST